MSGVSVPVKGVALVASLGVVGGFVGGFSVAERIYADEHQKSAVRTGASLAAAVVAIVAAATAIGVLRSRTAS